MKSILGKKQYMSQVFKEDGKVYPVTVVSAPENTVVTIKTIDKDGYEAVQLGFGVRKEKNIKKPAKGQMKGLGNFEVLREFRQDSPEVKEGDKLGVTLFAEGDEVTVSSISKAKGFQGVVKRHGFGGGPRSHGQKHSEREPGSIGGGGRDGGRVAKGMRMAGRTGGDRVTVKNLKVVGIDAEKGEILIGGAIPGRKGTIVEIKG